MCAWTAKDKLRLITIFVMLCHITARLQCSRVVSPRYSMKLAGLQKSEGLFRSKTRPNARAMRDGLESWLGTTAWHRRMGNGRKSTSIKRALRWRGGSIGMTADYRSDETKPKWVMDEAKEGRANKAGEEAAAAEMEAELKPRVLFVLGGPGSGKGTQCKKMATTFPFMHLSAGDLLRAERDRVGSKVGELINQYITEGRIVPVEITVSLLKAEMEKARDNGNSWFLIDGFPRSHENLRGWTDVIGEWADVVGVIFLDCPEDEMEKRILLRAQTEGRNDDNIQTIKKRFHTYEADTMPVIDHYRQEEKLFTVSACGDSDSVFANVKNLIKKLTDLEEAKEG
mmetsp:Transcript_34010/g.55194  ORF Transcript_34010/g.55194 Transcript_34010/m.55194 type:complete len:341 (-) Transcript_34010:306-1328(-)